MLRTHTNGELRITEVGQEVTLCGWVHKSRDKGGMIWVDLRDRYGITQLMLEEGKSSPEALAMARGLGREFVIDAVNDNGAEIWVTYTRIGDRTSYRCLAEAFTHRFSRTEHDSRA